MQTGNPMHTLRRALKRYRYLARQHRYGGMHTDLTLAQNAIEALDHVQPIHQPTLLPPSHAKGDL